MNFSQDFGVDWECHTLNSFHFDPEKAYFVKIKQTDKGNFYRHGIISFKGKVSYFVPNSNIVQDNDLCSFVIDHNDNDDNNNNKVFFVKPMKKIISGYEDRLRIKHFGIYDDMWRNSEHFSTYVGYDNSFSLQTETRIFIVTSSPVINASSVKSCCNVL